MPINVLLADNTAVMRRAIKFLLSDNDEIRIVGEASNFLETIEKTMDLSPEVIVLDLNMPDRSSFTATELKAALHGSKVVAISFGVDEEAEALAEGLSVGHPDMPEFVFEVDEVGANRAALERLGDRIISQHRVQGELLGVEHR